MTVQLALQYIHCLLMLSSIAYYSFINFVLYVLILSCFVACFYLLLNLAEVPEVQEKICNKGIVYPLLKLLVTKDDIGVIILTFLLRFSIYAESESALVRINLIQDLNFFYRLNMDVLIE